MLGRMVVGIDENGYYDGIWAGFAGLKRRVSRITMEARIDLRM